MDNVMLVKQQAEDEKWLEIITECRNSGNSVTEWCNSHGIKKKNYYYHLRKLREKICEQIAVPVAGINTTSSFVATVHSGDISVEVRENCSYEFISSLIKALKC